jgi:indole-3-acetate monooxygenase
VWSSDPLRESHAVQQIVSYTDAAWKAARAGLHKTIDNAWQDVVLTGVLSLEHRMEIRQAATYAIHVSRDVAHQVFHEAGSTAIFNAQPFERRLCDVNSVSQQLQGRRTHFESVGHYRLGGEPNLSWI